MTPTAIITAATKAGLSIKIDGDSLLLSADHEPTADLIDAITRHKAAIITTLRQTDDGPHAPCPRCGSGGFWRASYTNGPWHCLTCVPPHPALQTDSVTVPIRRGGSAVVPRDCSSI